MITTSIKKQRNFKGGILAALLLVMGAFLFIPTNAEAAYNPSYIMPDTTFSNSSVMTEGQIQEFLVSKGSYYANFTVPAARYVNWHGVDYYEGTMIGPVGQEVDSTGWPASRVIWQVSQWYGINPQVILTTIQKESSMITSPSPAYYGLVQWTMGYAYTEGGIVSVCDTATNNNPSGSCAGFAMQIDWAGGGLKHWYNCSETKQLCGVSTKYWAGETITIDGSALYIGNNSTGALYRYTPHNTYGGNFRTNYTNWFGSIDYDGVVPVYRFFNLKNNTHFYTASESEKINIILKWPTIYKYEGVAYNLNNLTGRNNAPLYRFYNLKNGTHFYTASDAEKNNIIARWPGIYQLEGISYNISLDPAGTTPVHRFWNKNGTHFYTASDAEKNNVIARWPGTFTYEGVAYFLP